MEQPVKNYRMSSILGLLVGLMFLPLASHATVVTLGEQDYTDGVILGSVAGFNAAQSGEAGPFGWNGSDGGTDFSVSWSMTYGAAAITSAAVTFGIWDHDSAQTGDQVASFLVDGIDLTAAANAVLNASGGAQTEYNVYTIDLTSVASSLSDGFAAFTLSLKGPAFCCSLPNNGAGFDFVELEYATAVPAPAGIAMFGLGLMLLGALRRYR